MQLKTDYDALAVSLGEADLERGSLAAAFAAKAGALAEVEAAHGAACAAGRDLQGRLDAAAEAHAELVGEVGRLRYDVAEKVGGVHTWVWVPAPSWRLMAVKVSPAA